MDKDRLFGGNPTGVIIRLVLLSIVVGIVFSALDITPANLLVRLRVLIERLSNLGIDAFHSAFTYFVLGAVVVIPIWLLTRLFGSFGKRDGR